MWCHMSDVKAERMCHNACTLLFMGISISNTACLQMSQHVGPVPHWLRCVCVTCFFIDLRAAPETRTSC